MPKILINEIETTIAVPIPLTANSGKIRIKNRSILNEYGITFATKEIPFKLSNYVEWMIGYDTVKSNLLKLNETTLPETSFTGANGKEKALYELSEYICHFHRCGIVTNGDLDNIENYIKSIPNNKLIDNNDELQINRDNFREKEINSILFKYTQVKYPLLVREFGNYEIVSEIKITEQQRAMAIQPMLYLCFPITEMQTKTPLIGRTAATKETAYFNITARNISVFLEIIKTFGILSKSHKYDILKIIELIKNL